MELEIRRDKGGTECLLVSKVVISRLLSVCVCVCARCLHFELVAQTT